jgi:chromosome segregation ATPase
LTSEFERIKILETKISHVVSYVNKLLEENTKLKQQVKEMKAEKKVIQENLDRVEILDASVKKYENEREGLKNKIEDIIGQIDQLGI